MPYTISYLAFSVAVYALEYTIANRPHVVLTEENKLVEAGVV